MENSLKGLILAAGTVITCLVITLGFYLSNEAQATAGTGAKRISKINTEFAESDKMMYDGVKVSGSEVVNAIRKLAGEEFGIYVVTKEAQTYYGYSFDVGTGELKEPVADTYSQTLSAASDKYINPYASFRGAVIRNANNVITGIEFVQE